MFVVFRCHSIFVCLFNFQQNRGWGTEMNPDLFAKQKDLWEQVSRRSSLSALSLASSVHKPITKAEKDAANNRKTSPSKAFNKLSHVQFIDNKLISDGQSNRVLNIRHHLGRTTGHGIYTASSINHHIESNTEYWKLFVFCFFFRFGGWWPIAIAYQRKADAGHHQARRWKLQFSARQPEEEYCIATR